MKTKKKKLNWMLIFIWSGIAYFIVWAVIGLIK